MVSDLFKISNWFVPLAQRVLFSWVRTTVFSEGASSIDPARPVCYVLNDRHLSNLLVLFEETRRAGLPPADVPFAVGDIKARRSVFFLNRHFSGGTPAVSRLLTSQIKAVVADPSRDIQLVPVVILWGRSPDKQESIVKALFAETWRNSGRIRQLLAVVLHGRQTLVRFNAPLSLRELVHGGPEPLNDAQALRKVSRILRVHFRRQRQMAIGPDLSHRNTQIATLLASDPVRMAIAEETARLGISSAEALARANKFALEIASDYGYGTTRALELFLNWLLDHLYDGILTHNIEALTQIAPGQGIVYVPCHRSHVDYLLLSFLIHRNGLTIPHIAAGVNLNMPIVGALLRRGGAFFLRRSFKGEPLYAAVFHEYLNLMLSRGYPIEYFIEGGRSRTGRTLTPKAGILGMTITSYVRSHNRPLVFVPVYIGYERLMEGETYVRELAGRPKQRENLWTLLASIRKVRRIYGQVQVNFGQPLPLSGFLDSYRPNWQSAAESGNEDWLRGATREFAFTLASRINDAAVINPVSLIALSLLATPRHTADLHTLYRLIGHFQAIDREVPFSAQRIACPDTPEQIIAHVKRLGIIEEIPHPFGNLVRVVDSQVQQLPYFRNNVLHLFALPALIACLLGTNHHLSVERLNKAIVGIYDLLRSALFLRWSEDALRHEVIRLIDLLAGRGLLRRSEHGSALLAPETQSQEFIELHMIGETVRPILGRHFLALALLQQRGSGKLTRSDLETNCQLLSQRLSLLHGLGETEASDKSDFTNLVANLLDAELLTADGEGLLHFDQQLLGPLAYAELVLTADTRQSIRRVAEQGPI